MLTKYSTGFVLLLFLFFTNETFSRIHIYEGYFNCIEFDVDMYNPLVPAIINDAVYRRGYIARIGEVICNKVRFINISFAVNLPLELQNVPYEYHIFPSDDLLGIDYPFPTLPSKIKKVIGCLFERQCCADTYEICRNRNSPAGDRPFLMTEY